MDDRSSAPMRVVATAVEDTRASTEQSVRVSLVNQLHVALDVLFYSFLMSIFALAYCQEM